MFAKFLIALISFIASLFAPLSGNSLGSSILSAAVTDAAKTGITEIEAGNRLFTDLPATAAPATADQVTEFRTGTRISVARPHSLSFEFAEVNDRTAAVDAMTSNELNPAALPDDLHILSVRQNCVIARSLVTFHGALLDRLGSYDDEALGQCSSPHEYTTLQEVSELFTDQPTLFVDGDTYYLSGRAGAIALK